MQESIMYIVDGVGDCRALRGRWRRATCVIVADLESG